MSIKDIKNGKIGCTQIKHQIYINIEMNIFFITDLEISKIFFEKGTLTSIVYLLYNTNETFSFTKK